MSPVRIRAARPSDAPAIAKVHVETWRATYAGLVPDNYLVGMSEEGQTFVWRKLLARPARTETVLVAQAPDRGPVVGFGSYGRARPSGLSYGGEIYTLYVAVDWQGQGIGRRLLSGLFGGLVEARVSDAFLWVLTGNPTRFFYEAMGGTRAATRQETFAGTLLDETAYAWPDLKAWLAVKS